METVQSFGGTPIVFPSYGMQSLDSAGLVNAFEQFAKWSPRFYGFELGEAFVPFGRIFTIDEFAKIMDVSECVGAKHSSLRRTLEWERLALRNKQRPEFQILTGNDLAIDMVTFGSDYLLGLAAFAPELFALRDAFWKDGDPRFFELNDALQYLGAFSFRSPTPAYRHSAAMFLKLTSRIVCDATHPQSPKRPDSDSADSRKNRRTAAGVSTESGRSKRSVGSYTLSEGIPPRRRTRRGSRCRRAVTIWQAHCRASVFRRFGLRKRKSSRRSSPAETSCA